MEVITPDSEEHWLQLRAKDVTSTEASALFGFCPHFTKFELWHRKKENLIVDFKSTERTTWGNRLEHAIAQGVAEDCGWQIARADEYIRDPELRMGASFDYWIGTDGILEIKNVDALQFKDGWIIGENKEIEAPPHIELQVQQQLALSGRKFAYIAPLVGGNTVKLIYREPDSKIIAQLKARIASFWSDVDADQEPAPDFERDAKVIQRLYSFAEPGKILECDKNTNMQNLASEYKLHAELIKDHKKKQDAIKAKLLMELGDAEKATSELFTISAGMVGPAMVPAHERKGYRNFRINWRKNVRK